MTAPGYIDGSNAYYEQISTVEGLPDRLVIYPGRLLHSAVMPPNAPLSDDPYTGRLTTNIFVSAA